MVRYVEEEKWTIKKNDVNVFKPGVHQPQASVHPVS